MRDERILSRDECEAVLERARRFARGGGDTAVEVTSWWQGELRWARNRVSLSSDRRNVSIRVWRLVPGGDPLAYATTNQLDDASLEAAVRTAERISRLRARPGYGVGYYPPLPHYEMFPDAAIWSDATFGLGTEARGEVARSMIALAEGKGLLSAGYLEVRAGTTLKIGTEFPELRRGEYAFWEQPYVSWTQAQCSTTVRDSTGAGSGWAGLSSYDWGRIDSDALAERAVQKCIASQNPVALEPGRYTVILEPQAVADLLEMLVGTFERERPEDGLPSPWKLAYDPGLNLWRSKLGLKVADSRITIRHDPRDPELGIVLSPWDSPEPVAWIERGVLASLGHRFTTDMTKLEGWHDLRGATGYRVDGGDTSIEEMIRSTRRGLLVTRLSSLRLLDRESLLSTGLTRDGLWLIENGEITKAVRNFRFTESPLFVLYSIEELGESVPVFRPTKRDGGRLTPALVPAMKVREFSFTSLIDAI